jgi:hypothetical protein
VNWRHYLLLFALGLIVPLAIAQYQTLPGYMDADYYFAGGIQLATGKGFMEPYIWNYLGDPQSLPTPSHTYWMPLASIVSAIGMWITSQTTYAAGRLSFILLSACVPLLLATLAFDLSKNRLVAIVAGLLSIFSQYYAPFMPVTDNYSIYMVLGSAFFLLAPRNEKWIPVALGALSGLMTLARSDGLLWLGLAGLTIIWKSTTKEINVKTSFKDWLARVFPGGLFVIVGYLLIMGPWHYRNITLLHSFLTPGGGRLLWLQDYRDTFIYPADRLTFQYFLQAGWGVALQNRINALYSNLVTAFFAQGAIFLLPFMLAGLWNLRNDLRVKIAVIGWAIAFLVMSVIFPFAGARGSFHHAGAAVQPLFWAVTPIGMNLVLDWLRKNGRFTDRNAPLIFQSLLVLWAVLFTLFLVNFRVVSGWAKDDVIYAAVEQKFQENGISPKDVVIVPNPPGYYVRSGRSAIRLPVGDESTIRTVAEKFNAKYLVLEQSNSLGALQSLYDEPQTHTGFIYLGEVEGAHLYRVVIAP